MILIPINKHKGLLSSFLLVVFLINTSYNVLYGGTGGPYQQDYIGITPINRTELVDKFTGKFNYNIPLLVIGDCPINIAYDANVTMGTEASWVGLGWTLNPGSVNRIKRGIPDDFKGDKFIREVNRKPIERFSATMSGSYSSDFNIFKNSDKVNILYDSELGWGTEARKKKEVTISAGIPIPVIPGMALGVSKMNSWDRTANTFTGVSTVSADAFSIGLMYYVGGLGYMNTSSTSSNSRYGLLQNTSYSGLYANLLSNSMKFSPTSVQSFIDPSYNPSANISYHSQSTFDDSKRGIFLLGFARGSWKDKSYYLQKINEDQKLISTSSYGYLYSNLVADDVNVLMDVNREKDLPNHDNVPYLSIPSHTNDLFLLNQHENGGQFRAYKNEIGIMKDPLFQSTASSSSESGEGFYGTIIEEGANFQATNTRTSGWSGIDHKNNTIKNINFKSALSQNPLQEGFYFKKTDELEEEDLTYTGILQNKKAVSLTLSGTNSIDNVFMDKKNTTRTSFLEPVSKFYSKEKSNVGRFNMRNTAIFQRDFTLKNLVSIDKSILTFNKLFDNTVNNNFPYQTKSNSSLVNYNEVKHQIAEFFVTNPDGKSYTYGLPLYNILQEDVVFSSKETNSKDENDLVVYDETDASKSNINGKDNYFNKEITPKYAHTWMLTSITTPDYFDITSDGPSLDDLGEITKVNYTNFGKYSWRTPLDPKLTNIHKTPKALFYEGIEFETNDNKGIYSYGEREDWYTHSIESKTEIAFFFMEDRLDAAPTNKQGDIDLNGKTKKQRLKKIVLYSKAEIGRVQKEYNNPNMNVILEKSIPLKTIEFHHSYKLCPKMPNNLNNYNLGNSNTGKLTLDSISIFHGGNVYDRSVYKFSYSSFNPPYSVNNTDRWGNYKTPADNQNFASGLPNSKYPYSSQNANKANLNATAWLLTEISLPTGATMKVDYESNTYGYVQDKRAAKMYKLVGCGSNSNENLGLTNLYLDDKSFNNYLFFESENTTGITNSNVKDLFFKDNNNLEMEKYLYYEAAFILEGTKKQLIPGYLEIEDIGLSNKLSNGKQVVWIKIKKYKTKDKLSDNHPMSINAWQFVRDRLPEIAYEGFVKEFDADKIRKSLELNKKRIIEGEENFEKQACRRQIAKNIELNGSSWIRALIPNNFKYGGGSRVSKLTVSDGWNQLVNPNNDINIKTPEKGEYTIDYEYNLSQGCVSNNPTTSGVTTYEPLIGGSENPWRMPVFYEGQSGPGGPGSMYNFEKPFGEMLFPTASIGYARIKESKNKGKISTLNTSNGYNVFEFYTAKDYPIENDFTELIPGITRRREERLSDDGFDLLNLVGIQSSSTFLRKASSQGYSIILNDMHGQLKSSMFFAHGQCDNQNPLNSSTYSYRSTRNLPCLSPNGSLVLKNFSENLDFTIDKRVINTLSSLSSFQPGGGLLIGFMLPPVKVWGPVFSTGFSIDEQFMNFVTTSKVFRNNHTIEKITVFREGAEYKTENKAWDANTLSPVVSSVNNEYGQTLYTFKPSANWAHINLGQSIMNQDAKLKLSVGSGAISIQTNGDLVGVEKILKDGDVCIVEYELGGQKFSNRLHAFIEAGSFPKRVLIDAGGNVFTPQPGISSYSLYIMQSGLKNILNAPLMNVIANDNPIVGNQLKQSLLSFLNGSSIKYNSEWPYLVTSNYSHNSSSNPLCFSGLLNNPFIAGNRNNHKIQSKYRLEGNRKSLTLSGSLPNKLFDGYRESSSGLTALHYIGSLNGLSINNNAFEWFSNSYNTLYDVKGNLLESALKVSKLNSCIYVGEDPSNTFTYDCCSYDTTYNSTRYGYFGLAPVVSVNNAMYGEIDFISFEENNFELPQLSNTVRNTLNNRIIPFYSTNTTPELVGNEAHTGKYALKIESVGVDLISKNCLEETLGQTENLVGQNNYKYSFNLLKGKRYKINFWIKTVDGNEPVINDIVEVQFKDNADIIIPLMSPPQGVLKTGSIEGWYQYEIQYEVPLDAAKSMISVKPTITGISYYIDDVRHIPVEASASSFVYSHKSLRLLNELDENHFATFYDYDESGSIVRVRKETENGIITIKEVNANLKK
jgi:hypothetical protein